MAEAPQSSRKRVFVFGSTGVGKSSLINILAEQKLADVSHGAIGCTFQNATYQLAHEGMDLVIVDTVGLNEGDEGKVPGGEAFRNLKKLFNECKEQGGGFHLAVLIHKGRFNKAFADNYKLFVRTMFAGELRCILVMNGCESFEKMDDWYNDGNRALMQYNIQFHDVLCCCSQTSENKNLDQAYSDLRAQTYKKVWASIIKNLQQEAWVFRGTWYDWLKNMWHTFVDLLKLGDNLKFVNSKLVDILMAMGLKKAEATKEALTLEQP